MENKIVSDYSEDLKKIGIENEVLQHPSLKKPADVLGLFKLDLSYGSGTMILKADDSFVAVIRRDDCKLNLKRIKQLLKVKDLRIANGEEFEKVTGVQVGTARVYTPGVSRTIVDRKVFDREYLIGGSGSFEYSVKVRTELFKKIPKFEMADVADIAAATESISAGVQRVFSGIRATGRLHIGNYLGAVKGMLELANSGNYETIYCVVDVHSITTPFDSQVIVQNKREIIIDYLAAGLDPEKSILIYQSSVPEHMELAFYFSSVVSIGRMQDLPTFKDKVRQHPKHTTMALLNYPILMAADILVYKAGLVPVGIDQEPHLEIAREIARKMNAQYGMDFPEPKRFATKGEYVPSLKGEGKMGKSIEGSSINLTDSKEDIQKKVRSIPTATQAGGEMNDGVKALFAFAELFVPQQVEEFKIEYNNGALQFSGMKDAIAETVYNELMPFQKRREEIAAKTSYVDNVIADGAERAREIASKTVKEVKEKMGLG